MDINNLQSPITNQQSTIRNRNIKKCLNLGRFFLWSKGHRTEKFTWQIEVEVDKI
jgi:hypothetical protein